MKIKIKSREEIEKTLDASGLHIDRSTGRFAEIMFTHCGQIFEANTVSYLGYSARTDCVLSHTFGWYWHKDWYEVVEPDFTEEDLMDIELMDEMLAYFMEGK